MIHTRLKIPNDYYKKTMDHEKQMDKNLEAVLRRLKKVVEKSKRLERLDSTKHIDVKHLFDL